MGGAIEVGQQRVVHARNGGKPPDAERGEVRRGLRILVQARAVRQSARCATTSGNPPQQTSGRHRRVGRLSDRPERARGRRVVALQQPPPVGVDGGDVDARVGQRRKRAARMPERSDRLAIQRRPGRRAVREQRVARRVEARVRVFRQPADPVAERRVERVEGAVGADQPDRSVARRGRRSASTVTGAASGRTCG